MFKQALRKVNKDLPSNGDVVLSRLLGQLGTEEITFEKIQANIRHLAYFKWDSAGRPYDKSPEDFWAEAEVELFGPEPLEDGGYHVFIRTDSGSWSECIIKP